MTAEAPLPSLPRLRVELALECEPRVEVLACGDDLERLAVWLGRREAVVGLLDAVEE